MGDGSTGPGGGSRPNPGRTDQTPDVAVRLLRMLARLLVRATDTVMRWITRQLGESSSAGREDFSQAELRALVAHSRVLDGEQRRLIGEVLAARERSVRALMVPRTEVVFLDAAMTIAEARRTVRDHRHSRFPVVNGSHDDVTGFVHLRDLLMRPEPDRAATVAEITRPVCQLPAGKRALAALSEMRRAGDHLALVVDEYGGTAGIVTLEDLIEEFVGEIHDEYDAAPDVVAVDGTAPSEVDGLLNLADFAGRVGFELAAGPYDTVGGFLMAALGRVPELGDTVRVGGVGGAWRLTVVALDGRRVARVALSRPGEPAPEHGRAQPVVASPFAEPANAG